MFIEGMECFWNESLQSLYRYWHNLECNPFLFSMSKMKMILSAFQYCTWKHNCLWQHGSLLLYASLRRNVVLFALCTDKLVFFDSEQFHTRISLFTRHELQTYRWVVLTGLRLEKVKRWIHLSVSGLILRNRLLTHTWCWSRPRCCWRWWFLNERIFKGWCSELGPHTPVCSSSHNLWDLVGGDHVFLFASSGWN